MKRMRIVRKYWIIIGVVLLLVGCTKNLESQVANDHKSPTIQVNIPTDIAQQYGSLNIEYKTDDIQKSIHSNGEVSLEMQEEQLNELKEQSKEFFLQFANTTEQYGENGIVKIEFDHQFANWVITLVNKDFFNKESFELAQEILIKNILTYQLASESLVNIKVSYILTDGTVLDERILRTHFAYVRE